ncbi:hypothetical protein MPSEU_000396800 [Mayamaea pseudoterrestris]|nr:hypothetical protein MPSEU_000396800 [Mayamaea pseudoterrestris]
MTTNNQQTIADAWNERSLALATISQISIALGGLTHPTLLRRLAAIVYRTCSTGSALGDAIPKNVTYYVDEPNPDLHPRAGARTSGGILGYVADVTRVRRHFLEEFEKHHSRNHSSPLTYIPIKQVSHIDGTNEFTYVCDAPPGQGVEEGTGWDIATNRIQINGLSPNHTRAFPPLPPPPSNGTLPPARILCAIYTYAGDHRKTQTLAETWGWRCDGYFAASTKTVDDPNEPGFGAIDLPHFGPEMYNNMWQKTRSILGYIYDNYMDEDDDNSFDYFYVAGNDLVAIVENMRYYIAELESKHGREQKPIYSGLVVRQFATANKFFDFAVGGPGYILNRQAIRIFIEQLAQCHGTSMIAVEDRFVGKCLNNAGIKIIDSANNETHQQRFFDLSPAWVAGQNENGNEFIKRCYKTWAEDYGHGWKYGMDLISEQSVVFHRMNVRLLKRFAAILYKSCPVGTVLGDTLGTYQGLAYEVA